MPIEAKLLESGVTIVTITGRLALGGEVEHLDTTVTDLLKKERKTIVLDLAAMDYADSSGIGMLVSCLTKTKKAGGVMRVAGANPRIQRIFKMTGVDSLMPMFANASDAAAG